jgi:hypothetical protein
MGKYKIQRIPTDVFVLMENHRYRLQTDVGKLLGKNVRLPKTKFLRYIFSPNFKRHIELDLNLVARDVKRGKR